MRILLIAARYYPHRGGLETVVSHLAQEFHRLGHEVLIVTHRWPRTLPAEEVMDGIPVKRLFFIYPRIEHLRERRLDLFLAGLWYGWYSTRQLGSIIQCFQPDVINQHYLGGTTPGLMALRIWRRRPWVVSLHGGDVDGEPRSSRAAFRLLCAALGRAVAITACSSNLADQAARLAPGLRQPIQVIHNGVDLDRFRLAKPHTHHRPYLLAVGQLAGHKGFELLLRAYADARVSANMDLLLAGDGPLRGPLEALATRLGLRDSVRFWGRVDEQQVASLMAGCRFVAMPSLRESFGIVALEAMAAGKPLLATPVGGLPEFADLPGNRLVSPDEVLWAAALAEFADRYGGDLPTRLEESMRRAVQFAWPIIAQRYLNVYNEARQA